MQAYVEKLVLAELTKLSIKVEQHHVQIGLWSFELKLTNLTIPSMILSLQNGMLTRLESCRIGSIHIVIPWTQLHYGTLNCVIDNVTIKLTTEIAYFEERVDENDIGNELLAFKLNQLKQNLLKRAEELFSAFSQQQQEQSHSEDDSSNDVDSEPSKRPNCSSNLLSGIPMPTGFVRNILLRFTNGIQFCVTNVEVIAKFPLSDDARSAYTNEFQHSEAYLSAKVEQEQLLPSEHHSHHRPHPQRTQSSNDAPGSELDDYTDAFPELRESFHLKIAINSFEISPAKGLATENVSPSSSRSDDSDDGNAPSTESRYRHYKSPLVLPTLHDRQQLAIVRTTNLTALHQESGEPQSTTTANPSDPNLATNQGDSLSFTVVSKEVYIRDLSIAYWVTRDSKNSISITSSGKDPADYFPSSSAIPSSSHISFNDSKHKPDRSTSLPFGPVSFIVYPLETILTPTSLKLLVDCRFAPLGKEGRDATNDKSGDEFGVDEEDISFPFTSGGPISTDSSRQEHHDNQLSTPKGARVMASVVVSGHISNFEFTPSLLCLETCLRLNTTLQYRSSRRRFGRQCWMSAGETIRHWLRKQDVGQRTNSRNDQLRDQAHYPTPFSSDTYDHEAISRCSDDVPLYYEFQEIWRQNILSSLEMEPEQRSPFPSNNGTRKRSHTTTDGARQTDIRRFSTGSVSNHRGTPVLLHRNGVETIFFEQDSPLSSSAFLSGPDTINHEQNGDVDSSLLDEAVVRRSSRIKRLWRVAIHSILYLLRLNRPYLNIVNPHAFSRLFNGGNILHSDKTDWGSKMCVNILALRLHLSRCKEYRLLYRKHLITQIEDIIASRLGEGTSSADASASEPADNNHPPLPIELKADVNSTELSNMETLSIVLDTQSIVECQSSVISELLMLITDSSIVTATDFPRFNLAQLEHAVRGTKPVAAPTNASTQESSASYYGAALLRMLNIIPPIADQTRGEYSDKSNNMDAGLVELRFECNLSISRLAFVILTSQLLPGTTLYRPVATDDDRKVNPAVGLTLTGSRAPQTHRLVSIVFTNILISASSLQSTKLEVGVNVMMFQIFDADGVEVVGCGESANDCMEAQPISSWKPYALVFRVGCQSLRTPLIVETVEPPTYLLHAKDPFYSSTDSLDSTGRTNALRRVLSSDSLGSIPGPIVQSPNTASGHQSRRSSTVLGGMNNHITPPRSVPSSHSPAFVSKQIDTHVACLNVDVACHFSNVRISVKVPYLRFLWDSIRACLAANPEVCALNLASNNAQTRRPDCFEWWKLACAEQSISEGKRWQSSIDRAAAGRVNADIGTTSGGANLGNSSVGNIGFGRASIRPRASMNPGANISLHGDVLHNIPALLGSNGNAGKLEDGQRGPASKSKSSRRPLPGPIKPTTVDAYVDRRILMALAIGLRYNHLKPTWMLVITGIEVMIAAPNHKPDISNYPHSHAVSTSDRHQSTSLLLCVGRTVGANSVGVHSDVMSVAASTASGDSLGTQDSAGRTSSRNVHSSNQHDGKATHPHSHRMHGNKHIFLHGGVEWDWQADRVSISSQIWAEASHGIQASMAASSSNLGLPLSSSVVLGIASIALKLRREEDSQYSIPTNAGLKMLETSHDTTLINSFRLSMIVSVQKKYSNSLTSGLNRVDESILPPLAHHSNFANGRTMQGMIGSAVHVPSTAILVHSSPIDVALSETDIDALLSIGAQVSKYATALSPRPSSLALLKKVNMIEPSLDRSRADVRIGNGDSGSSCFGCEGTSNSNLVPRISSLAGDCQLLLTVTVEKVQISILATSAITGVPSTISTEGLPQAPQHGVPLIPNPNELAYQQLLAIIRSFATNVAARGWNDRRKFRRFRGQTQDAICNLIGPSVKVHVVSTMLKDLGSKLIKSASDLDQYQRDSNKHGATNSSIDRNMAAPVSLSSLDIDILVIQAAGQLRKLCPLSTPHRSMIKILMHSVVASSRSLTYDGLTQLSVGWLKLYDAGAYPILNLDFRPTKLTGPPTGAATNSTTNGMNAGAPNVAAGIFNQSTGTIETTGADPMRSKPIHWYREHRKKSGGQAQDTFRPQSTLPAVVKLEASRNDVHTNPCFVPLAPYSDLVGTNRSPGSTSLNAASNYNPALGWFHPNLKPGNSAMTLELVDSVSGFDLGIGGLPTSFLYRHLADKSIKDSDQPETNNARLLSSLCVSRHTSVFIKCSSLDVYLDTAGAIKALDYISILCMQSRRVWSRHYDAVTVAVREVTPCHILDQLDIVSIARRVIYDQSVTGIINVTDEAIGWDPLELATNLSDLGCEARSLSYHRQFLFLQKKYLQSHCSPLDPETIMGREISVDQFESGNQYSGLSHLRNEMAVLLDVGTVSLCLQFERQLFAHVECDKLLFGMVFSPVPSVPNPLLPPPPFVYPDLFIEISKMRLFDMSTTLPSYAVISWSNENLRQIAIHAQSNPQTSGSATGIAGHHASTSTSSVPTNTRPSVAPPTSVTVPMLQITWKKLVDLAVDTSAWKVCLLNRFFCELIDLVMSRIQAPILKSTVVLLDAIYMTDAKFLAEGPVQLPGSLGGINTPNFGTSSAGNALATNSRFLFENGSDSSSNNNSSSEDDRDDNSKSKREDDHDSSGGSEDEDLATLYRVSSLVEQHLPKLDSLAAGGASRLEGNHNPQSSVNDLNSHSKRSHRSKKISSGKLSQHALKSSSRFNRSGGKVVEFASVSDAESDRNQNLGNSSGTHDTSSQSLNISVTPLSIATLAAQIVSSIVDGRLNYRLCMRNVMLIMPSNTSSLDLVGLKAGLFTMQNTLGSTSWSLLSNTVRPDLGGRNGNFASDDVDDNEEATPSFSVGLDDRSEAMFFDADSRSWKKCLPLIDDNSRRDGQSTELSGSRISSSTVMAGWISHDQRVDSINAGNFIGTPARGATTQQTPISHHHQQQQLNMYQSAYRFGTTLVSRMIIQLTAADVFVSLAGHRFQTTASNLAEAPVDIYAGPGFKYHLSDVVAGGAVFQDISSASPLAVNSTSGQPNVPARGGIDRTGKEQPMVSPTPHAQLFVQHWRKVSEFPFHLQYIQDYIQPLPVYSQVMAAKYPTPVSSAKLTPPSMSRILISDMEVESPIVLNLSILELSVLENVWYDNIAEASDFFAAAIRCASSKLPFGVDWNLRRQAGAMIGEPLGNISTSHLEAFSNGEKIASAIGGNLSSPTKTGKPDATTNSSSEPKTRHHENLHFPSKELPSPFPTYGSAEYLSFLRNRPHSWEFQLLRSDIKLSCFIDVTECIDLSLTSLTGKILSSALGPDGNLTSETSRLFFGSRNNYGLGRQFGAALGGGTRKESDDRAAVGGRRTALGASGSDQAALDLLDNAAPKMVENMALPFASLLLSSTVLQCGGDDDVLCLSLAVGYFEIVDTRCPKVSSEAVVLSVGLPGGRRKYGSIDYDFGLNVLPPFTNIAMDSQDAFRVSLLRSTLTNWNTCNVGLNSPNMTVSNMDMISLLMDYFASYFWFPQLGNPNVSICATLKKLPYGGADTRVFVVKPHIAVMKNPLVLNSQSLFIESDRGAFFRTISDSNGNKKIQLNICDAAIVILRHYKSPREARGNRGAAGSGRGVRTLVEYFSCGLSLATIVVKVDSNTSSSPGPALNPLVDSTRGKSSSVGGLDALSAVGIVQHQRPHIDIMLNIEFVPEDSESASDKIVKVNGESNDYPQMAPVEAPLDYSSQFLPVAGYCFRDINATNLKLTPIFPTDPSCVSPFQKMDTTFTATSLDVVISYEDILFCAELVDAFLRDPADVGDEKQQSAPRASPGSPGRQRTESDEYSPLNDFQTLTADNLAGGRNEASSTANPLLADPSMLAVVRVAGVRIIVIDNLLGLHLPFIQIFLQSADLSLTKHFAVSSSLRRDKATVVNLEKSTRQQSKAIHYARHSGRSKSIVTQVEPHVLCFAKAHIWAENFNNLKKCWEQLLESFCCTLLYEKTPYPGTGVVLRVLTPTHINISVAFIKVLDDILRTFENGAPVWKTHQSKQIPNQGKNVVGEPQSDSLLDNKSGSRPDVITTALDQRLNEEGRIARSSLLRKSVMSFYGSAGLLKADVKTKHITPQALIDGRANLNRHNRPRSTSLAVNRLAQTRNEHIGIKHFRFPPLLPTARVGFSILNMTGQPVRYLQTWTGEGNLRTIEYLMHGELGLLNFIASTTRIRNNAVIEEAFGVQQDHGRDSMVVGRAVGSIAKARSRTRTAGHLLKLQVSGYKWLLDVRADVLGVNFADLIPIEGCPNVLNQLHLNRRTEREEIFRMALKLVTEVIPNNGGRTLKLRSVFTIVNNTSHAIHILAKYFPSNYKAQEEELSNVPFRVEAGDTLCVPLALLYRSAVGTGGKFLGRLLVKPSDLSDVKSSFDNLSLLRPTKVEYSHDSLDLFKIAEETYELFDKSELSIGPDETLINLSATNGDAMQLCCAVRGSPRRTRTEADHRLGISHSNGPLNHSRATSPSLAAADSANSDNELGEEDYAETDGDPRFASMSGKDDEMQRALDEWDQKVNNLAPSGTSSPTAGGGIMSPAVGGVRAGGHGAGTAGPSSNRGSLKLPPFCYNAEVCRMISQTDRLDYFKDVNRSKATSAFMPNLFMKSDEKYQFPVHYSIILHPPIMLENALPSEGVFEIVHKTHQRVLWKSNIGPGQRVPIHSVTLDDPLVLRITLRYCRTVEGIEIHDPRKVEANLAQRVLGAIEGVFSDDRVGGDLSVDLIDSVGQYLRLNVENTEGGGGQRNVVVYTPYWIINTTQYAMRIMEDGSSVLPAGTVTLNKDGSRPVFSGFNSSLSSTTASGSLNKFLGDESTGYFPGRPGLLSNPDSYNAIEEGSESWKLLAELTLAQMQSISYMFNYRSDSMLLGTKRVCVQLEDSDWSHSFSLDNLEIIQSLSIGHPTKGILEVGFNIKNAPGPLGKYTKIVRFMPKFIVLNKLPQSLALVETGLFSEQTVSVGSVPPNRVLPLNLMNVYGERKLAIQIQDTADACWMPSVPFEVDLLGGHTLLVNRKIQLSSLDHINTRGLAVYDVEIKGLPDYNPPAKEFGLFFETDWSGTSIVVKGYKEGSIAFRETDIQIGDVLISIDGEHVEHSPFEAVMAVLKSKIHSTGCTLTFRTVEEKMRLILSGGVRVASVNANSSSQTVSATHNDDSNALSNTTTRRSSIDFEDNRRDSMVSVASLDARRVVFARSSVVSNFGDNAEGILGQVVRPDQSHAGWGNIEDEDSFAPNQIPLRVELRQFESASLIVVQKADNKAQSEYRLHNKSVAHIIYFKQKNVVGNRWQMLWPGQEVKYIWENPFETHKLMLRAGENILCPTGTLDRSRNMSEIFTELGDTFIANPLRQLRGGDGDSKIAIVSLDEIGFRGKLPLVHSKGELNIQIESEGPSKQLYIFPESKLDPEFGSRMVQVQTDILVDALRRLRDFREQEASVRPTEAVESGAGVRRNSLTEQLHAAFSMSSLGQTNSSVSNTAEELEEGCDNPVDELGSRILNPRSQIENKAICSSVMSKHRLSSGGIIRHSDTLASQVDMAKRHIVRRMTESREQVIRQLFGAPTVVHANPNGSKMNELPRLRSKSSDSGTAVSAKHSEKSPLKLSSSRRVIASTSPNPDIGDYISSKRVDEIKDNPSIHILPTDASTAMAKFTSVLGDDDIPDKNFLLVQVLEAKDLKPFVTGKLESTFCQVRLKLSTLTENTRAYMGQHNTYVFPDSFDPEWIGQKFLIPVPERTDYNIRGIKIRIAVKATSVLPFGRLIGHADIQLSCLKAQNRVCGWFPLRPSSNSSRMSVLKGDICGSIKLNLQWINTDIGLLDYTVSALERRLEILEVVKRAMVILKDCKIFKERGSQPEQVDPSIVDTRGVLLKGAADIISSTTLQTAAVAGSLVTRARAVIPFKKRKAGDFDDNETLMKRSENDPQNAAAGELAFDSSPQGGNDRPEGSVGEEGSGSESDDLLSVCSNDEGEISEAFESKRNFSVRHDDSKSDCEGESAVTPRISAFSISTHNSPVRSVMRENSASITPSSASTSTATTGLQRGPSQASAARRISEAVAGSVSSVKRNSLRYQNNVGVQRTASVDADLSTPGKASKKLSRMVMSHDAYDLGVDDRMMSITNHAVIDSPAITSSNLTRQSRPDGQILRHNFSSTADIFGAVKDYTEGLEEDSHELHGQTTKKSTLNPIHRVSRTPLNDHGTGIKAGSHHKLSESTTLFSPTFAPAAAKSVLAWANLLLRLNCSTYGATRHQTLSHFMHRHDDLVKINRSLRQRIIDDCQRNFNSIHTSRGQLQITALQALHIPNHKNKPVYVTISYGEKKIVTAHVPYALDLNFDRVLTPGENRTDRSQSHNKHNFKDSDRSIDGGGDAVAVSSKSVALGHEASHGRTDGTNTTNFGSTTVNETASFAIDTLNVKGTIKIAVKAENFPRSVSLAQMDLPIFPILDCTVAKNASYERWFPLLLSADCIPAEGEFGNKDQSLPQENKDHSKLGYNRPCIKLRLKWIADADIANNERFDHLGLVMGSETYSRFQFPEISVSVLDTERRREIMQIDLSGIELRQFTTKTTTEYLVNIASAQVDNQLPDATTQVILHPTHLRIPQPTIRLYIRKNLAASSSYQLACFDVVEFVMQELDVNLEQQTVMATWVFLQDCMIAAPRIFAATIDDGLGSSNAIGLAASSGKTVSTGHGTDINPSTPPNNKKMDRRFRRTSSVFVANDDGLVGSTIGSEPNNADNHGRPTKAGADANASSSPSNLYTIDREIINEDNKLYISHFKLHPVKINISFVMTMDAHNSSVKTSQALSKSSLFESKSGLLTSFTAFMRQIGELLLDLSSNITRAPIFIHATNYDHLLTSEDDLSRILKNFYFHSIVVQMYKMVGSLDFVGNPYGLVSSLTVGVSAFLYEPTHALISNPTDIERIGRAAVKGTVALVGNTADGLISTGTTITRSAGRGFAKLTMDDVFLRRREELQRRPVNATEAWKRPLKDIGNGFYCGIVGVVRVPMVGAQRAGVVGFSTGLVKGVAGLISKPVVGVLDAITHTGDNASAVMKVVSQKNVEPVRRKRLGSLFGPDGRVLPYRFAVALGSHALRVLDQEFEGDYLKQQALKLQRSSGLSWLSASIAGRKNSAAKGESAEVSLYSTGRQYRTGSITSIRLTRSNSIGRDKELSRTGSVRMGRSGSFNLRDYQAQNRGIDNATRNMRFSIYKSIRKSIFKLPDEDAERLSQALADATDPAFVDRAESEAVVYTAIVKRDTDTDELIIVSTHRIGSVKYRKDTGGSKLTRNWLMSFAELSFPSIHFGGGATLTLYHKINDPTKHRTIVVDTFMEETLVAVHKCICVLTGRTNEIDRDDCDGLTYDPYSRLFRLGSWEYDDPHGSSSHIASNGEGNRDSGDFKARGSAYAEGFTELDFEPWDDQLSPNPNHGRDDEPKQPGWLILERANAIQAHADWSAVLKLFRQIREKQNQLGLEDELQANEAISSSNCDYMFLNGFISYNEYKIEAKLKASRELTTSDDSESIVPTLILRPKRAVSYALTIGSKDVDAEEEKSSSSTAQVQTTLPNMLTDDTRNANVKSATSVFGVFNSVNEESSENATIDSKLESAADLLVRDDDIESPSIQARRAGKRILFKPNDPSPEEHRLDSTNPKEPEGLVSQKQPREHIASKISATVSTFPQLQASVDRLFDQSSIIMPLIDRQDHFPEELPDDYQYSENNSMSTPPHARRDHGHENLGSPNTGAGVESSLLSMSPDTEAISKVMSRLDRLELLLMHVVERLDASANITSLNVSQTNGANASQAQPTQGAIQASSRTPETHS